MLVYEGSYLDVHQGPAHLTPIHLASRSHLNRAVEGLSQNLGHLAYVGPSERKTNQLRSASVRLGG